MSSNGNGAGADVIKRSVTRADHEEGSLGIYYFLSPTVASSAPGLPAWWSPQRDHILRTTIHREAMWASAVSKSITKQAALGWQVTDTADSKLRTKRAQDLLLHAQGNEGWVAFLYRHLQDYLLTDSGAFVEVVRATKAAGSRILGLVHLDSCRCIRTGDITIPVLFRDRVGREHELKTHQVITFADMPSASETYNGVGFCAASRAYDTIMKLAGLETYVREKVTGTRSLAIHIVGGLSAKQLDQALNASEQDAASKGRIVYRGAMVIAQMGDVPPTVTTIPLAELPDGFDAKQERDNAYMIYANALGVAVQDIQPLSGQGIGTGTQTVILDEAAEGYGLAAWRKQWEHSVNELLLPDTTTFAFATNDIRDQRAAAEVQNMRATTRAAQIESGEITPEQALQMAVDAGDVPKEFLAEDETPGGSLTDTEKPLTEESERAQAGIEQEEEEEVDVINTTTTSTSSSAPRVKAISVADLIEGELGAALELLGGINA